MKFIDFQILRPAINLNEIENGEFVCHSDSLILSESYGQLIIFSAVLPEQKLVE